MKKIFKQTFFYFMSICLIITSIFVYYPKNIYAEDKAENVYVPAIWYPVKVEDKTINIISPEEAQPIEVYHKKNIENPKVAILNEKSGKYEISLNSTSSPHQFNTFMDTSMLLFTDKYFHVSYQGKSYPSDNPSIHTHVLKYEYGNNKEESPYLEQSQVYYGLSGMKMVPYIDNQTMKLYVSAKKIEVSEATIINKDSFAVPLYKDNKRNKKNISNNVTNIIFYHPRKAQLQEFINSDVEGAATVLTPEYKAESTEKSFKEMTFYLYDKNDKKYIVDENNEPVHAFDKEFNTEDINTEHNYELVILYTEDKEDEIRKWITSKDNLDMPSYDNAVFSRFPRFLYAYKDSIHFPIHFIKTITPTIEIKWEDDNNSDNTRPEELTLNIIEKDNNTSLSPSLTLSEKNNWKGEFDGLPVKRDGKEITYELASIPDLSKQGYTAKTEGNANDGFTITYTLENKVTVSFDANGGTFPNPIAPITLKKNTALGKDMPELKPTREGYKFKGWSTDKNSKTSNFTKDTNVSNDITVYAVWENTNNINPSKPTPTKNNNHHKDKNKDRIEVTTTNDLLDKKNRKNYLIGYENDYIKPENNITRAEVATIFFRLLKDDVRNYNIKNNTTFTDVSLNSWFNKSIGTMNNLGLIKGRTTNHFAPLSNITRAEFAAIASRFDNSNITNNSDFNDISDHWAKNDIQRAANLGWIKGYPDGSFKPDQNITRAEAVTLINRMLERLPRDYNSLLPDMKKWKDNDDVNNWYYLAIQSASNSYEYEKVGIYEIWTKINPLVNWNIYQ